MKRCLVANLHSAGASPTERGEGGRWFIAIVIQGKAAGDDFIVFDRAVPGDS